MEDLKLALKMQKLDEIVKKMSESEIDIDNNFKLFKEGMELITKLKSDIKLYEEEINKIKNHG